VYTRLLSLRKYGYDNVGLLQLSDEDDFQEALRVLKVKKPHHRPLVRAFLHLCSSSHAPS
jgi:hypothetical protein